MGKIIREELSRKIIGVGLEVLNKLKPGLDQKLYECAMIIELKRGGHIVSVQRSFPVASCLICFVPTDFTDNTEWRKGFGNSACQALIIRVIRVIRGSEMAYLDQIPERIITRAA